jgi:hypothetical protein
VPAEAAGLPASGRRGPGRAFGGTPPGGRGKHVWWVRWGRTGRGLAAVAARFRFACVAECALVAVVATRPGSGRVGHREHREQPGQFIPGRPGLVQRQPGHRVRPQCHGLGGTRRSTPAPVAGTVEADHMAPQDPLRIPPQKGVNYFFWTVLVHSICSTQNPSPWSEPDPPDSSTQGVTSEASPTVGPSVRSSPVTWSRR